MFVVRFSWAFQRRREITKLTQRLDLVVRMDELRLLFEDRAVDHDRIFDVGERAGRELRQTRPTEREREHELGQRQRATTSFFDDDRERERAADPTR